MPESGATPQISRARRALLQGARALTTPLVPDDYIELMNPLWSTRELQGVVQEVRHETADAATVVVKPNFPWPGHVPGQYVRIGTEIDGIRHWRAYSLTSDPDHPKGLLSITVKHVEEGKMSPWFVGQAERGSNVFLGDVEGTFTLPEKRPEKAFMLSAGSGITPIMSMIRELDRCDELNDVVHVHSGHDEDDFIFSEMLTEIAKRRPGYELKVHISGDDGRIGTKNLDKICKDWRDRDAFASGPGELLDLLKEYWEDQTEPERLRMERFQPTIGEGDAEVGDGGTVRFRVTDVEAECKQGESILVGGEDAGGDFTYGCRMGICHTCVGRLCEGKLRDLRTGEVHGEEGQMVRICVNAPEGHVEIDL
ncbi:ferredoxin reductase [soil metagenome]